MKSRVPSPKPEYLEFLSPYGAEITRLALGTRTLVLGEAPDAIELIYDAYNAVAAGYSFTGRPSDSFIHIAAYAGWVNLGFNQGSLLEDPQRLLKGSGQWIRHTRIAELTDIERPWVRAFVKAAIQQGVRPLDGPAPKQGTSIVRAIYAKRRRPEKPRRP